MKDFILNVIYNFIRITLNVMCNFIVIVLILIIGETFIAASTCIIEYGEILKGLLLFAIAILLIPIMILLLISIIWAFCE